MPTARSSIPSSAAAARSGSTTDRSRASSALGDRQGGELYSSWPPGSKVTVPPAGSSKHGMPFAVQVSFHPWRAPNRRRNGRVPGAAPVSSGHRRPVVASIGMSSTSAPTRRGVSDALGGAAKACSARSASRAARMCLAHAGAPTTRANSDSGSLRQASISKPRGLEQLRYALPVVLAADLGPERLAGSERDRPDAGNHHQLRPARHEVHLDPVRHRLVECQVVERGRIEVRAQLVVQHQQHVPVELRRDALGCRCRPPRCARRPSAGPRP